MRKFLKYSALGFGALSVWVLVVVGHDEETKPASSLRPSFGDTAYTTGRNTIIFPTMSAWSKAYELRQAGASERLQREQISCVVVPGTKVLIQSNGESAFLMGMDHALPVLVIVGPDAGCRGVVPDQFLSKTPPEAKS
jgi:hypothetical protein